MYQCPTISIDLTRFRQNLSNIAAKLSPGAHIIAVIKSDAYGHGLIEIARVAAACEAVVFLAVVRIESAIQLRQAGILTPILLLVDPLETDIPILTQYAITPVISTARFLSAYQAFASTAQKPLPFHLKFDTGMSRFGFRWDDNSLDLASFFESKDLCLEGICTHLSSSEIPDSASVRQQLSRFETLIAPYRTQIPYIHACATGGFYHYPMAHYSLLRLGACLYEDVMSLNAVVADIKYVRKGETVGYGDRFVASDAPRWIGILGCGYSNGVPFSLGESKTRVAIHSDAYPIIGAICMDVMFIDLGDNPKNVQVGDTARILGPSPIPDTSTPLFATRSGLNLREVWCHIGGLNTRSYKDDAG